MNTEDQFKTRYAYQAEVKSNPVIQAWLARVCAAVAAMAGVDVVFATTLQNRCEENKIFHDHSKQKVAAFLAPMLASVEHGEHMDEECLPYYRVRFADGVELLADDAELFSLNPNLGELIAAVSGAFAVARDMGYAGPWELAAKGTPEEQERFLGVYPCFHLSVPFESWGMARNTPPEFRAAASIQALASC